MDVAALIKIKRITATLVPVENQYCFPVPVVPFL
jgi:hypothetical protein